MKPVKFKGANVTFAEDQPEYKPLPAFKDGQGNVVTCWEVSNEDFEKLVETRRIYLSIKTFNNPLQPVFLSADVNEVLIFENEENGSIE
jgi:hypothetical protein